VVIIILFHRRFQFETDLVKWQENYLSFLHVGSDQGDDSDDDCIAEQEPNLIGENVNSHNNSDSPDTVYIKEARIEEGNLEVRTVSSIVSNFIQRLLFSVLGSGMYRLWENARC
jgi:hypothetical protein